MKKTMIGLSIAAAVSLTANAAHARGAALCIAKEKNSAGNSTDVQYFVRHGGTSRTTGYDADSAAREDFKKEGYTSTPSCRNTARKFMDGGFYAIIRGGRKKDYAGAKINRWAFGYGESPRAALNDAKKELMRRDWSWVESKHGYKLEDDGEF